MTAIATSPPNPAPQNPPATAAHWHRALGEVPLERILLTPPPGTATEADVVRLDDHEDVLVELVDATLVRKIMGFTESQIAINIAIVVGQFVRDRKLGVVAGEAGMLRMTGGNVRIPDVSFIRREDLPGGRLPREPVPQLRPALVVEVLSPGNTEAEMLLKLHEYFDSGAKLVWLVQPTDRTVRIYDAPDRFRQINANDTLDGGNVLPGFEVKVSELFAV